MEALRQKVKEDGVVIGEKILKVDGFLNHQIDAQLMYDIGETFYEQFKDQKVTKILTVEASGIAPAIMVAYKCCRLKIKVFIKQIFIHLQKIKRIV